MLWQSYHRHRPRRRSGCRSSGGWWRSWDAARSCPVVLLHRQIEIVLMEPAQRLPRAAKLLHLVEDQRDRLLHTPVWILLILISGLHEAHRRADDKLPSARLLVAGGQRALA